MARPLVRVLPVLALCCVALGGEVSMPATTGSAPPPSPPPTTAPLAAPPAHPRILWRRCRALGKPWAGRLARGTRLPVEGEDFFTWDPVAKRRPNRWWRRYACDFTIRKVLAVLRAHRLAFPDAPRVGIGDLSRPRGGWFGKRFGGLGHASHQNGVDVDLYYPRLDGLEREPRTVRQIDLELAQDLVDRFVRAGARYVFVGPNTDLTGPRPVVERLIHHDNHLHVRFRAPRGRR